MSPPSLAGGGRHRGGKRLGLMCASPPMVPTVAFSTKIPEKPAINARCVGARKSLLYCRPIRVYGGAGKRWTH